MNRKGQLGITENDEVGGYAIFILVVAFLMIGSFVLISSRVTEINEGVLSDLEHSIVIRNIFYSGSCFINLENEGRNLVDLSLFNDEQLDNCLLLNSPNQVALQADLLLENETSLSASTANFKVRFGMEESKYKYKVVTQDGINGVLELRIK